MSVATKKIQQKMQILEGLFQLAYSITSKRVRRERPTLSPEQVHERAMELIQKGCEN